MIFGLYIKVLLRIHFNNFGAPWTFHLVSSSGQKSGGRWWTWQIFKLPNIVLFSLYISLHTFTDIYFTFIKNNNITIISISLIFHWVIPSAGVSARCPACGQSWMWSGVRHVFSLLPSWAALYRKGFRNQRDKQPLFHLWARWNYPVSMRDLWPLSCRYRGPPDYCLMNLTVWNGSPNERGQFGFPCRLLHHYVTRVHLCLAAHCSLPLSNAYHTPPVKGQCVGDKMEPVLPAQSLCG